MKQATTALSSIVILCRNLQKTTAFYSTVLGLKVTKQSPTLSELRDSNNNIFLLKKHLSQSALCKGYSPVLNFSVNNFQAVCDNIKLYELPFDGEVVNDEVVKMATFRGVEGEIISITNYFEEVEVEKEQVVDATAQEIKRILNKIKQ